MEPTSAAYGLSCALTGHLGAVRAICALDRSTIVTGAMDTEVPRFVRDPEAPESGAFMRVEEATIYGHEHWVTALVRIPAGVLVNAPNGGFATGCMDKHIRVFNLQGGLLMILRGHDGGVISLALSDDQRSLVSGSWDGTARVWNLATFECEHVLREHENGVCVLGLPNGIIVTGSTGRQEGNAVVDFQLRFWADYSLVKTVRDHNGPIRQLVRVDATHFASCSNDGSIRVRTLDGAVTSFMEHPLNEEGKPGFVLGVTVVDGPRIVSASEDCTARVWSVDGALLQVIEHPGGLWCVAALADGDFVTGCDDKVARIFTQDATKQPAAAQAEFVEQVENARIARQRGPSGVEIAKLPGYEQRGQMSGKSDGFIQMFRKGDSAWACQWSAPSKTWIDIGEVTGTGSGGVVDGKAYDMVIPVEIDQAGGGMQHLEIGYNQGDNPFSVAQTFIDEHMLDQAYLREIADYITQRAGEYRAPVLGSVPNETTPVVAASTSPRFQFFPVSTYNTFEATKIGKLMTTVRQFNEQVDASLRMGDAELAALDTVVKTLQETAYYHSSTLSSTALGSLVAVVAKWPLDRVFPLLDLLRLVLVHPQGPSVLGSSMLATVLQRVLKMAATLAGSGGDVPVATPMLALRVVANLFLRTEGRTAILSHKPAVLAALPSFGVYQQKTVALSLATVILNLARLKVEEPAAFTDEDLIVLGSMAFGVLNNATSLDALGDDVVLRSLVAVGTISLDASAEVRGAMVALLQVFAASKTDQIKPGAVQDCYQELTQCLG